MSTVTADEAYEAVSKTHTVMAKTGADDFAIQQITRSHLDDLWIYGVIDRVTHEEVKNRLEAAAIL